MGQLSDSIDNQPPCTRFENNILTYDTYAIKLGELKNMENTDNEVTDINENELKMIQTEKGRQLKPWMGFALFFFAMGLFVTVCGYMQRKWGITGLILTELLFLCVAILYAVGMKQNLREVFPIKRFTFRDFFGCVFLLISGYLFSLISIYIVAMIVLDSMEEAAQLSGLLYGKMNLIETVIVVALFPAICEESIHRGAILANFRSVKKKWIVIIIMGLFFSINHLSILRGPFTFIVGMMLTYVVITKNNLLLSMLMHFMLNGFSSVMSYFTGAGESAAEVSAVKIGITEIGASLVVSFAAPVFFVIGTMLINPEKHRHRRFIFAGILSALMLIGGMTSVGIGMKAGNVMSGTFQYDVTAEGQEYVIDFKAEQEGDYTVRVTMSAAEGEYRVCVNEKGGEEACAGDMSKGTAKMYDSTVFLTPGDYEIVIINGKGSVGQRPYVYVQVKK